MDQPDCGDTGADPSGGRAGVGGDSHTFKMSAPHTQFICKCNRTYCQFCEGGLYACTVCGGFEGTLTTDCCGRMLTKDEEDKIYHQQILNFRDGQWREEDAFKQEIHT